MPARGRGGGALGLTYPGLADLEALPAGAQQKILNALRQLETSPFGPTKVKKLKGKGVGQWRLEVWPYRVRYDVEGREVVLYRVRHRKDVYRE
jgi:mRNA-degrading endonuclease RelE of RelBE toxin-antitoxin system